MKAVRAARPPRHADGVQGERPDPREGGPPERFAVERASASPRLGAPAMARRRARPAQDLPPVAGPLRALQEWFQAVITDPRSAADGVRSAAPQLALAPAAEIERVLVSSPRLAAIDRIGIYHYAYHARLVDCLADDFPSVVHALGRAGFAALARAIIARYPSDHPNLNRYGQRLVRHCLDARTRLPRRAFIAELAALEWAMVEVLHAQAAPTLSLSALQGIPLARWGAVRFKASETVRLLHSDFPVNRYLQAQRDGSAPALPGRRASATAIYRKGFTVWRMDLTMPMAGILASLFRGEPLGRALASLARAGDPAEQGRLAALVMTWFRDWVQSGFFAAFAAPARTARAPATPARRPGGR
jgi:hypothetical protein